MILNDNKRSWWNHSYIHNFMTSSQSLVFCFCEEGLISRFILLLFNRWWSVGLTKSASTYKAVSNHHSAALFTLFSTKTWPSFCSSDTRFQAGVSETNFQGTFEPWQKEPVLWWGLFSQWFFKKSHFVLLTQDSLAGYIHSGHLKTFKGLLSLGAIFTVKFHGDPISVG